MFTEGEAHATPASRRATRNAVPRSRACSVVIRTVPSVVSAVALFARVLLPSLAWRILAVVFAILAGILAYWLVPETHVSEAKAGVKPWEIDTSKPAITIGLVNFGLFFAYLGGIFTILVLFVDEKGLLVWGYGPQGMSGLLMAVAVLSASVFMLGGGK